MTLAAPAIMAPESFSAFLRARHGPNWVLAPRSTARLRERYDTIISPKAYAQAEIDYTATTGRDPNDPQTLLSWEVSWTDQGARHTAYASYKATALGTRDRLHANGCDDAEVYEVRKRALD